MAKQNWFGRNGSWRNRRRLNGITCNYSDYMGIAIQALVWIAVLALLISNVFGGFLAATGNYWIAGFQTAVSVITLIGLLHVAYLSQSVASKNVMRALYVAMLCFIILFGIFNGGVFTASPKSALGKHWGYELALGFFAATVLGYLAMMYFFMLEIRRLAPKPQPESDTPQSSPDCTSPRFGPTTPNSGGGSVDGP